MEKPGKSASEFNQDLLSESFGGAAQEIGNQLVGTVTSPIQGVADLISKIFFF